MACGARWRRLRWALAAVGGLLVLMQLVPYGWSHPNPPVVQDAPWPSARSEALARAACYDCHSNEVEWPAYAYVAPVSWLVRRDVEQGRAELNFSLWGAGAGEVDEGAETVEEGSMPPRQYLLAHPAARLSDDEKAELVAALESLGDGDGDGDGDADGGEDEDDGDDDRRGPDRG
ncbi:MAG TPA: heme-binding domain-containing protein, partial [Acidimicrobiales bacterium]|nr:heme-binding domain-containing protein [Acidimicrobiales bacterium]